MFDTKTWNEIAKGMKGNADALLALSCFIAAGGFLAFGINAIVSIGFPLIVFALYVGLRLSQKRLDVRIKEIEFDSEKESNRIEFEKRKDKVLK